MLSARAYSFRQQSKLAISLSWIGGYVNVVTFIVCHWFTSHITGTTTHFGRSFLVGNHSEGLFYGFLLLSFLSGAVASALMTEGARRRGWRGIYVLPMLVEALLLCIFSAGLIHHTSLSPEETFTRYWMTGVAAFAMGLQNATITRISGDVVRTTHLTGVLTDLGLESIQLALWYFDKLRRRRPGRLGRVLRISRRHPSVLRVALLASIFGSFLFGVIVGMLVYQRIPSYSLAAPIGFLFFILYQDRRHPIADVQELDLLSDPELKLTGLTRAMLPSGLGVYRLSHTHPGRTRNPNFTRWADRLPARWRVVILAISPMTRFDSNAALDLEAAVRRLRARRKQLIITGLTPVQYRALDRYGVSSTLELANFCPDLELAIARGMSLIEEM